MREHLVIYKALYDGRPYGIDVVPDQVFARPTEMFFQKSIMENIPISNKNTDSKDFRKVRGLIPWLFYFLTLFTY